MKIQRYAIDLALLGKQLSFVGNANSTYKGKVEFAFAAYSGESSTMIGQRLQAEQTLSQKDLESLRKGAYRAQEVLDIPSTAVCLRLAVHDMVANRVGAMEIPLPLANESTVGKSDVPH